MMWKYKLCLPLTAVLLFAVAPPAITDAGIVQSLYDSAQKHDPAWLEARQNHTAAIESLPQAQSSLLPQLSLRASRNRQWQQIDATGSPPFDELQNLEFNSFQLALELRQTIYNRDRYLALTQAQQQLDEADARLMHAGQDLVLRLATAVFGILSANEDLGAARSEQHSLQRQLQQAEQRLEIGLGTKIDVEEARAAYDLALARALEAENSQAISLERLYEISTSADGARLLLQQLSPDMPLANPQPADRGQWANIAIANNYQVQAAQQVLAQAEEQIQRARSGHYPTLDLVGSQAFASSGGGRFGETETNTSSVGIEFSLPLFAGGSVNSLVRAAIAQRDAAREQLEQFRRSTSRGTSESYLNVLNSIQRSEALEQAVRSSEAALEAIRTGFDIGTRTSVDVVDAERSLSGVKRDLAQARHTYVLDLLRLYMAASKLDRSHMEYIDRWLVKRPVPAN